MISNVRISVCSQFFLIYDFHLSLNIHYLVIEFWNRIYYISMSQVSRALADNFVQQNFLNLSRSTKSRGEGEGRGDCGISGSRQERFICFICNKISHIRKYINLYVHTYKYIYIYTHIHVHRYMYLCIQGYIYYIYTHIYIHIVHTYIYTYTHVNMLNIIH